MKDNMKIKLLISCPHPGYDLIQSIQRKTIQFPKLIRRNHVFHGIEIGQISQEKSTRIADASISFSEPVQDFRRNPYIITIIFSRDPQS